MLLYPPKRNTPPNVLRPIIFVINSVLEFLHEFCYVGVGIYNSYFGSFLRVYLGAFSLYVTFIVYWSTIIQYVIFVTSCSSYSCVYDYYYLGPKNIQSIQFNGVFTFCISSMTERYPARKHCFYFKYTSRLYFTQLHAIFDDLVISEWFFKNNLIIYIYHIELNGAIIWQQVLLKHANKVMTTIATKLDFTSSISALFKRRGGNGDSSTLRLGDNFYDYLNRSLKFMIINYSSYSGPWPLDNSQNSSELLKARHNYSLRIIRTNNYDVVVRRWYGILQHTNLIHTCVDPYLLS